MIECVRHQWWVLLAVASLGLFACSHRSATQVLAETVQPASLTLSVQGRGELKAIHSTPLQVPGKQWTPRQLVWVAPDGSIVHKGELVARFSPLKSRQDLAEAMIDLQRNTIARAGKQAELDQRQSQLDVDLAGVASQLAIAHRYANATLLAVSRNKILDAVQDVHYLDTRQSILDWRRGQSSKRGQAALAVLGAQRDTYELNARQKRSDLDALELRAPHDGILVLEADWSGQKPHVGASLFAGMPLGSLPDTSALQLLIAVPQVQAQGIRVGDDVRIHPQGQPQQTADTRIRWVAAAAQTRSHDSPVKYMLMKARVPASAVKRYHWIPGEQFTADIILLHAGKVISVPNLAIDTSGDHATVQVREGARIVRRTVRLGVRGSARSEVLEGLKPGDEVVLDNADKDDG